MHHPLAHKICRDQTHQKDNHNGEDETQSRNVKGEIGTGIILGREKTKKPVRRGNHDLHDIDATGNGDEDEQSRQKISLKYGSQPFHHKTPKKPKLQTAKY